MQTPPTARALVDAILSNTFPAFCLYERAGTVAFTAGYPRYLHNLHQLDALTVTRRPLRVVAAIPFCQAREAGFEAAGDDRIAVVDPRIHATYSRTDLLTALPTIGLPRAPVVASQSDEEYSEMVRRAITQHIAGGDVCQIVLSRTFTYQKPHPDAAAAAAATGGGGSGSASASGSKNDAPAVPITPTEILSIYGRLLRGRGQYSTFLFVWSGSWLLAGASPERHIVVDANHVALNPIAGTMPKLPGARARVLSHAAAAAAACDGATQPVSRVSGGGGGGGGSTTTASQTSSHSTTTTTGSDDGRLTCPSNTDDQTSFFSRLLMFLADRKEADELAMVVDEELKMLVAITSPPDQQWSAAPLNSIPPSAAAPTPSTPPPSNATTPSTLVDPGASSSLMPFSPRSPTRPHVPDRITVAGPFLKDVGAVIHTEYVLTGRSPAVTPMAALLLSFFQPTLVGSPLQSAFRVIKREEMVSRRYYGGVLAVLDAADPPPARPDSWQPPDGFAAAAGECGVRPRVRAIDGCILIRTMDGCLRCGIITVRAGAGIVRLSQPAAEAAETFHKAQGATGALFADDAGSPPPPPSTSCSSSESASATITPPSSSLSTIGTTSTPFTLPPTFPDLLAQLTSSQRAAIASALASRNTRLSRFWLHPSSCRRVIALEGVRVVVVDNEDRFVAMLAAMCRSFGMFVRTTPVVAFDHSTDVRGGRGGSLVAGSSSGAAGADGGADAVHGLTADVDDLASYEAESPNRSTCTTARTVADRGADVVLIGPGPGDINDDTDPRIADVLAATRSLLTDNVPTVGVCLGLQAIAHVLGGTVPRSPFPTQGLQQSCSYFDGRTEAVAFYCSFAPRIPPSFDEEWDVARGSAVAGDDGLAVFAMRGKRRPVAGTLFHPESILSTNGYDLLAELIVHAYERRPAVE